MLKSVSCRLLHAFFCDSNHRECIPKCFHLPCTIKFIFNAYFYKIFNCANESDNSLYHL